MTPTPQQIAEASKAIAESVPHWELRTYDGGLNWDIINNDNGMVIKHYIDKGWTIDALRVAWAAGKAKYGEGFLVTLAWQITGFKEPGAWFLLECQAEMPIDQLVMATASAFEKAGRK